MLRIKEAMENAKESGKKVTNKSLGDLLWPDTKPNSRSSEINFGNLLSGKTTMIKIEWIKILCDELNVTPNFLFGYE